MKGRKNSLKPHPDFFFNKSTNFDLCKKYPEVYFKHSHMNFIPCPLFSRGSNAEYKPLQIYLRQTTTHFKKILRKSINVLSFINSFFIGRVEERQEYARFTTVLAFLRAKPPLPLMRTELEMPKIRFIQVHISLKTNIFTLGKSISSEKMFFLNLISIYENIKKICFM